MGKKLLSMLLLFLGFSIICCSVGFAVLETANTDIVGGADIDTFIYVFTRAHMGGYSIAAVIGVITVVASFIVYPIKRK